MSEAIASVVRRQACPSCSSEIEHDVEFTPWCPACDWNAVPGGRHAREPGLGRIELGLGRAAGERLARELATTTELRPPAITVSTMAALGIVCVVFACLLLLVLAAIWLIVAFPGFWKLIGVGLLLVAALGHPRLGSAPDEAVAREEFPELYRLVDELAATMSAPRIETIAVDGTWNARTMRFGLRQRHALVVGLPVWRSLEPDERVAVLAHEVAHGVNRDTARIVPVSIARQTLLYWVYVLAPDELVPSHVGIAAIVFVPINLGLLALSAAIAVVAAGLTLVTLRHSQRSEYYADRLAARVSGTEAIAGALETLLDASSYERAVRTCTLGRRPGDLWTELARQRARTPPSELERLRRSAIRRGSRLGDTHPPLPLRIELLRHGPVLHPTVHVSEARMARIDAELERLALPIARTQILEYREALGG